MLSEIPSVDITRSLNPFLFAALANCFSFLDFLTAALSSSVISRSSFSSGGVTIPSMISSYPLSSAITLNFRANSCQLSFVLLNLYTLILFRPSFSSLILQYFMLIFSIKVYLCFDRLLDSSIGSPDQYIQCSFDLTLSLVGCTSRAFSLFNRTFINMLKNLCS